MGKGKLEEGSEGLASAALFLVIDGISRMSGSQEQEPTCER